MTDTYYLHLNNAIYK